MISSLRSAVSSGGLGSACWLERVAGARLLRADAGALPAFGDCEELLLGVLALLFVDFDEVVLVPEAFAGAAFDLPAADLVFGGAVLAGGASDFLAMHYIPESTHSQSAAQGL